MPASKEKSLSPYSIRFTEEERAFLDKHAAGMSWADYIRARVFDEFIPKRRTRNKTPVKDYWFLSRILGELGRSRIANNLNQIARAVNTGTLIVSAETERLIQEACRAVIQMRDLLLQALGLKS